MKIAYLLETTEFCGGVRVALAQAEALARRGHRVTVVSPEPAPGWFPLLRAEFERSSFSKARALVTAEVRVATFWRTVPAALAGAAGPVFHLSQGYEGHFGFYRDLWPEIEAVYRLPTRKLAISKTLASVLEARGFGPVVDVGQAFDPREFAPGPARPTGDPPIVLVVGTFEADVKGIDIALKGLELLRARGGRFRLRRVSTLPPSESERSLDLTDEFHHHLPPERMPFAYRSCDVFVGPSRSEEGFGLPVVEALASGVPTLLSDTPGHREIGGDAAWYFRDGDPESLAEALPALLTAPARAHARARGPAATAGYDPAGVAQRLEGAFLAALGSAG